MLEDLKKTNGCWEGKRVEEYWGRIEGWQSSRDWGRGLPMLGRTEERYKIEGRHYWGRITDK